MNAEQKRKINWSLYCDNVFNRIIGIAYFVGAQLVGWSTWWSQNRIVVNRWKDGHNFTDYEVHLPLTNHSPGKCDTKLKRWNFLQPLFQLDQIIRFPFLIYHLWPSILQPWRTTPVDVPLEICLFVPVTTFWLIYPRLLPSANGCSG